MSQAGVGLENDHAAKRSGRAHLHAPVTPLAINQQGVRKRFASSRARKENFAAYVFLSAVGLRGVIGRNWATFCFAMALLVLLQTPAAQRAWPRLTWRWPRHPRPAGREGRPMIE